jgi:hypothetical protein
MVVEVEKWRYYCQNSKKSFDYRNSLLLDYLTSQT